MYFWKGALSDGDSVQGGGKVQTEQDDDIFRENHGISIDLYLWNSDPAEKKKTPV